MRGSHRGRNECPVPRGRHRAAASCLREPGANGLECTREIQEGRANWPITAGVPSRRRMTFRRASIPRASPRLLAAAHNFGLHRNKTLPSYGGASRLSAGALRRAGHWSSRCRRKTLAPTPYQSRDYAGGSSSRLSTGETTSRGADACASRFWTSLPSSFMLAHCAAAAERRT